MVEFITFFEYLIQHKGYKSSIYEDELLREAAWDSEAAHEESELDIMFMDYIAEMNKILAGTGFYFSSNDTYYTIHSGNYYIKDSLWNNGEQTKHGDLSFNKFLLFSINEHLDMIKNDVNKYILHHLLSHVRSSKRVKTIKI